MAKLTSEFVDQVGRDLDERGRVPQRPYVISKSTQEVESLYLSHDEPQVSAPQHIGELTAEVIAKDYEATAKKIELMREELSRAATELDQRKAEVSQMHKLLGEVADKYRERGIEMVEAVKRSAATTEKVRRVADEMVRQLNEDRAKEV